MPSVYGLKPAFQALLRPMVGRLAKRHVTANQVTFAALLLSGLTGALLLCFPASPAALLLLPPVLLTRMALNAIDGMLAREFGMASRLGAILNELGDVLADAALYLPLALRPEFHAPLLVTAVLVGVIAEMTGVIGVQIGASRRYDGPLGKSDRALAFGGFGLVLGLGVPAGAWVNLALAVLILLSGWTILNRARGALRESRP